MFTVRCPDGTGIVYNDAGYLSYKNGVWELYSRDPAKGGRWMVSLPVQGFIVEAQPACRVVPAPVADLRSALVALTDHLRRGVGVSAYSEEARLLVTLKDQLRRFNARKRQFGARS